MFIESIKKIKSQYVKIFLFNVGLIMFAYNSFFNLTFCSDNLANFMSPQNVEISFAEICAGGRYTNYIITIISNLLRIDYLENQLIIQIFKMLISAIFTTCILFYFVKESRLSSKDIYCANIILLINVINVFYVETFVYATPEWGIGLLLVLSTFISFTKQKYQWVLIFAFFAISQYQSNIIVILIMGISYVIIKNNYWLTKRLFCESFKLMFFVGIAASLNILSVKFFCYIGIFEKEIKPIGIGEKGIVEKILQIGYVFKITLYNSFGMMPRYSIIFFILFLLVMVIIFTVAWNKDLKIAFYINFVIIVLIISSFGMGFIMREVWLPPRVLFPFYVAIGFSTLLVLCYLKESIKLKIIVWVISIAFLIISMSNTMLASNDHYTSNVLDIQYAREVQEKINAYETTTGNRVKQVKFLEHSQRNKTWTYEEFMKHSYIYATYNSKIVYDDWGVVPMLKLVSNRDYQSLYMSNVEFETNFGDKEWTYIDLEKQIVFDGSIMYWAVY